MDPTGIWTARVARPRGTTSGTFVFSPNGIALLVAGGVGGGSWGAAGRGRFTFRIAEPRLDEHGGYLGWVHIEQEATGDGGAFTSSGVTTVYDADGRQAYRTEVSISAVRDSHAHA